MPMLATARIESSTAWLIQKEYVETCMPTIILYIHLTLAMFLVYAKIPPPDPSLGDD